MKVTGKTQRERRLNCVNKSEWERMKQTRMNRGRERKKKEDRIMAVREASLQHCCCMKATP